MGTSSNKIAIIAAFTTIWPTYATPQGAAANAGGVQLDFGLNSSLTVDDNFQLNPVSKGTSTILDTTLSFGLSNITPTQQLALTGSGVLRWADIPGRSTQGFEDPTLRFNYVLDAANSRISANARYRKVDREFLNPFQVEQEQQNLGTSLITDGGTLRNVGAGFTFETGLNDPLGFVVSASHDDKSYSNVTNANLFDNRTSSISLAALMRVSALTNIRLSTALTQYDADNPTSTSRRTMDYSLGVTQDINPVTVLTASIGYTDITTDDTVLGTPVTTTQSGFTGSVGLTRTVTDGSYTADLSTARNVNGARTTLRFSRNLQLPNGGLAASLGATQGDNGNVGVVGSLSYSHQLKDSNISLRLDRASFTNNLDQDVIDTRLGVAYGHEIDSQSRFDVTLDYGRSEDGGAGAAPTIARTNLKATYTRALTQDWNMTGGLQLRHRDDSTVVGGAQSNSVFLTVGRNFSFRP